MTHHYSAGTVVDAEHLRTLPDGTIITWLRIPADPTSEAVGFVRREVTAGEITVWITPGGWNPHTPESAGVTYPATIVRMGAFNPEHYLGEEIPLLTETLTGCVHGGTWAREKALECAARVYESTGVAIYERTGVAADVLDTARQFEAYLDPDDEPDARNEIVHVLLDADVVPYGEVLVCYADGRADELAIDGLVRDGVTR